MSDKRYLGNIITPNPTAPTDNFEDTPAPGVWSLAEAFAYHKAGLWPTAGNKLSLGIFMGGSSSGGVVNTIDSVVISTLGNATDFGDMGVSIYQFAGAGSATRAVTAGGSISGGATRTNSILYVTLPTQGNSASFGSLAWGRRAVAALSNSTRAVFGGGNGTSGGGGDTINVMEYVTIASTGSSTDFGDLSKQKHKMAGCASPTRGLFCGGWSDDGSGFQNVIDYITIASTGNTSDFGDMVSAREGPTALSSGTRAVICGGGASNIMEYVTIASTGNTSDFGDLTATSEEGMSVASPTRGVIAIGSSQSNVLNYIEIASTGNAADFGDLTVGRNAAAASSTTHGGLAA